MALDPMKFGIPVYVQHASGDVPNKVFGYIKGLTINLAMLGQTESIELLSTEGVTATIVPRTVHRTNRDGEAMMQMNVFIVNHHDRPALRECTAFHKFMDI